ncbi:hypothetical protein KIW84_023286 [Lathyrus oleraceus]|uniref:Uncharacterized protein n=1 Tax=Pisum sativum TaxID=3888 RepID=A0A9D5BBN4_PEA|nr:hypothetical protein KIW84_023286 [Pisum sativum]
MVGPGLVTPDLGVGPLDPRSNTSNALDKPRIKEDQVEDFLVRRSRETSSLWTNLDTQERILIQKSNLSWRRDGDVNNTFFHSFVKAQHRRNFISSIFSENGLIYLVGEVKEEVRIHIYSKFLDPDHSKPNLDGIDFKSIFGIDSMLLEVDFSYVEIKEAVWESEGSKSLGPDGYNFVFIRECWHFLKEDISSFIKEFHNKAKLSKAITSSLMTLVPKYFNPSGRARKSFGFVDFEQPIGLRAW